MSEQSRYTAREMRVRANLENNVFGDKTTAAMLRQAADLMEREEREKKYEYCVKYLRKRTGACIGRHAVCYDSLEEAKMVAVPRVGETTMIIRRSVGEWEEVKDGE